MTEVVRRETLRIRERTLSVEEEEEEGVGAAGYDIDQHATGLLTAALMSLNQWRLLGAAHA